MTKLENHIAEATQSQAGTIDSANKQWLSFPPFSLKKARKRMGHPSLILEGRIDIVVAA